jgi:hypothetical protein
LESISVPFSKTILFAEESVHVAPFWHGLLAHSSTSTSQLPAPAEPPVLSSIVHDAVYSSMKSYSPHHPFANPATHVHRYAWKETSGWVVLVEFVESVHVAPFWHGLLAHSSTSTSQLPMPAEPSELSTKVHDVLYSSMKL